MRSREAGGGLQQSKLHREGKIHIPGEEATTGRPHLHAPPPRSGAELSPPGNHLKEEELQVLKYHGKRAPCLGGEAVPTTLRKEGSCQKGRRAPAFNAQLQPGEQMAKLCQSKASSAVALPAQESDPRRHLVTTAMTECVFHISFLSPFPAECRDTTRYCEKVKQLKLCQLNQFKSRCCGTCGKA